MNDPKRTFVLVCGNESCPARGISFHAVYADSEELAELWIEQFGNGAEDPVDHCLICGELGIAMDYVDYRAMLGLGDTRNGMLWRCGCGNVTPRDPLTTPEELANCRCGRRAVKWKAVSLPEIWKEGLTHGG